MTHFLSILLTVSFLLSPAGGFLSSARAESGAVQKAIENVKESIGDLVGAKDEKTSDELGLRIGTFRKVLELSAAETKEFKISLLAIETQKDEDLLRWKEMMLESLKTAADHFENEMEWLSGNETTLTLEGIKKTAESFKKWREESYLSSVDQIQEFLLLEQERAAIKTAEKRLQKVTEEVKKILKSKGSTKSGKELARLLTLVAKTVVESRNLNQDGQAIFFNDHVFPLIPVSTSTVTSTLPVATTTPPVEPPPFPPLPSVVTTSTATSTASSTPALPPEPAPPTVKELVIASLIKIRDAYQIFIDMSALVRELVK